MKFYDRQNELELLKKADDLKNRSSIMTIVIGRRRVGKTTLVLQDFSKDVKIYFFVSKKDEALLCEEFIEELSDKLNIKIFGQITHFEELFEYILELSSKESLTLIIDEFQEFYKINPNIYASIQKLWDIYKDKAHLHFIACGSVYHLMKKNYKDKSEPLFGRANFKINLKPFTPSILKDILYDNDAYTKENLLDFYIFTGGVAKYIELFWLNDAYSFESMLDVVISANSLFLDEGKNRLIEEFGKEYKVYFSILSLIAASKTSKREMESILQRNVSGYLSRLENDYSIIQAIKPVGSKPNAKVQKYEIADNFLNFWFRFIFKYQSYIEAENFKKLKEIVKRDFSMFRGKFLEKIFIEMLKEKEIFSQIGTYWERGNKNEIDIVAIDDIDKKVLIAECKINRQKIDLHVLKKKAEKLMDKFKGYHFEFRGLSINDLP